MAAYDPTRDWHAQNIKMVEALTEKKYDVNYTWGIGTHSNKQGGAIMPEMLRWLWRDYPRKDDPKDPATALLVPDDALLRESVPPTASSPFEGQSKAVGLESNPGENMGMTRFSRWKPTTTLVALLPALCNATALWADVKPAALFSDHVVLQQGMPVPVWGWADPGESVAVSIAGQTQTTTAGADRKWMVRLNNLSATADPIEMTIAGKEHHQDHGRPHRGSLAGVRTVEHGFCRLRRHGEIPRQGPAVCRCREQGAGDHRGPLSADPRIPGPNKTSELPLDDVAGKWVVCTARNRARLLRDRVFLRPRFAEGDSSPHRVHHVGVGASCAQAWVSKDVLESDPRLKSIMDGFANRSPRSRPRGGSEGRCSSTAHAEEPGPRPSGRAGEAHLPTSTTPMFCGMR